MDSEYFLMGYQVLKRMNKYNPCAILCLMVSIVSKPLFAIEITPFGGEFQYGWYSDAQARLGNPGTFLEIDSSSAVLQRIDWFRSPANYHGNVESPIPGKVYDTSPILFQQPDGSFDTTATFPESWVDSAAGVGINEHFSPGSYSIGISSSSTARAGLYESWTATGDANANSTARVSSYFEINTSPGESSLFNLNALFLQDIFAEASLDSIFYPSGSQVGTVVSSESPSFLDLHSYLSFNASMTIRNDTTGEQLFNFSYLYDGQSLAPISNRSGNVVLEGLNADDRYWIELLVETSATARSDSEIVLEDPLCDPSQPPFFCVVDGHTYHVELSSSITSLDLTLVAESTVVPIPAAFWLFGSGLLGLVGAARLRNGIV